MSYLDQFEVDSFTTSTGELQIYFLGHGSLLLKYAEKWWHIDPFSRVADYAKLPKADVILVTHEHRDHLDPDALKHIRQKHTQLVLTEICARQVAGGVVMKPGDLRVVENIKVEAVLAYNLRHKRETGQPFHPKGDGNGYILTFGDLRMYVAGDTEDIPEMKAIGDIDIAFLPMNLPYTMTPEMVANAAQAFHPKIVYPYHYGSTDTARLIELLSGQPGIEVRIRKLA